LSVCCKRHAGEPSNRRYSENHQLVTHSQISFL
jgi:hypothetical protein